MLSADPDSTTLRGVLAAIRARCDAAVPFALAVVVATEGSTYRKPGAIALVDRDGHRHGVISGGCLEAELERLGAAVLASGRAQALTFDTQGDDDLLFGSGSGCRGRMVIVALPLAPRRDEAIVARVLALEEAAAPLAIACTLDGDDVVRVEFDGTAIVDAGPASRGGELNTYHVTIAPPPRVLLIGAGPEAPPLTRLARLAGWHVSVADHRAALANAARLPFADRVAVARGGGALASWPNERFAAVIAMTHSADADRDALRALAAHDCPYVGLLGPPRRRDELLACLTDDERARLAPRLRAPVGIALGGEGPGAIALSIAADLQRAFHARPAR